jgi:hypothetical protein
LSILIQDPAFKPDSLSTNQAKRDRWPGPKLISRTTFKDLILIKAVIVSFHKKELAFTYKRPLNSTRKTKIGKENIQRE